MPEVNYMPNPASSPETPTVHHSDSTIAGYGSPEGAVPAWPGAKYVDKDTGDRYTKESGDGTLTGWTADGSGSSGAGGALPTVGDPEGVLTADNLQLAWDSTNNVLYIHEGADGT